jgi:hypothetical protein
MKEDILEQLHTLADGKMLSGADELTKSPLAPAQAGVHEWNMYCTRAKVATRTKCEIIFALAGTKQARQPVLYVQESASGTSNRVSPWRT